MRKIQKTKERCLIPTNVKTCDYKDLGRQWP